MDIWIIQNGEKLGPFHDFDIRRKISSGEFHADLPAWHEGIASWTTLGQMTVFADEFARIAATPAKDPESTGPPAATPPPLPDHPFALRRFWARWLDLYGYTAIWWLTMWASGRDIAAILNQPWIMLMQYVPWFVIETWMIHRFTTTPGKWLLGIRILNANGSPLTLPEATRRSARVFFLGIGFGLELLNLVCQVMALITIKRLGRTLWDQAGNHRVTIAPLKLPAIVTCMLSLAISMALHFIVLMPYVMDLAIKQNPQLKEQLEQMPQWYLPKR